MEEFNRLLQEYKNHYLEFLSSGDQQFKTAYQRAYDAIESAIDSKRKSVESEKRALSHFVDSYKKTNETLGSDLVVDAQKVQDSYETSKQRYDAWTESPQAPPPPVNVGNAYYILIRLGCILILLPLLYFVSGFGRSGATSSIFGYFPSSASSIR
jgi:hypothetical protein